MTLQGATQIFLFYIYCLLLSYLLLYNLFCCHEASFLFLKADLSDALLDVPTQSCRVEALVAGTQTLFQLLLFSLLTVVNVLPVFVLYSLGFF